MSRKSGSILLGVLVAALGGLVALNLVLEPPAAPVEPRAAIASAVLGALVGQVEVQRDGEKKWRPAEVGIGLSRGDQVRTALFSEATLHLRAGSSVTLSANSIFEVGQEQQARSSFELGEGRMLAAIPGQGDRQFRFRSQGSGAVAAIDRGEFSMATDGRGTVVVDAREGEVRLKSSGKEVRLRSGKRSVVRPDAPPSDPLPVPASVALQVRWPPRKLDQTRARVSGKTEAGALVLVNGVMVRADERGAFGAEVPLREGKNRLVVTATGASGAAQVRRSPEIRVDTRPPDLEVEAEGLWQ